MQYSYMYLKCQTTRLNALPETRTEPVSRPSRVSYLNGKAVGVIRQRRERHSHEAQIANACWKLAFPFKISLSTPCMHCRPSLLRFC